MQLSLSQDSCVATCPHCGADNIFPGFSSIEAFICKTCGAGVAAGRPDIEPEDEPAMRALPQPRCRGVPIGDGNYTGCAYGYGDVPPFTGPCDCPVCNGSGVEGEGAFRPN